MKFNQEDIPDQVQRLKEREDFGCFFIDGLGF